MSRVERYDSIAVVTQESTATDDGFGGLKKPDTPTSIVASYVCMLWLPRAYSRQQTIAQYSLTDNAHVVNIEGAYDASIVNGLFATIAGTKYKILSATAIRGRDGAPVALHIMAVKVET